VVDVDVDCLVELRDAVLAFNWAAEKRACEAFIAFLLCLCSAHRNAVPMVLEMLVKQFRPVTVRVPDTVDPSLLVPSVDDVLSALVSSRALETLKEVVALVPTCTHMLQEILVRLVPHRRSPLAVLTGYTACVLRVATFAPSLRPALVKACIDLLLVLDVEIRIDDVQFSSPVRQAPPDPLPANPQLKLQLQQQQQQQSDSLQFDLDDPVSSRHSSRNSVVPVAIEDASVRLVRESADKLDALMLMMFEDIGAHCGGAAESELANATRRGLLDSFAVSVLTTSRCKFVQFLAFYCASLGGGFCATLLDMLLRKLADVNETPITRQCAAHYVGSLVSRARFVPAALRHQALVSLARYAKHYIAGLSPQAQRPSAPMHGVLYATVQAMLYGICFAYDDYSVAVAQAASVVLGLDDGRRGGDHASSASDEGAHWPLAEFELEHILSHDTMALKFCAPSVVDEFVRLAPSLGLPVVVQLLRRQRRVALPIDAQWPDANQQLFFPFDPYMLRLSSPFVDREDIYVHFTMPTVIETNAIAAFAPHHAAAFAAAAAALAAESQADADDDDDDAAADFEQAAAPPAYRVRHLQQRRQRRRSRSPHSSLSGSSIGTPTREVLHSLGHSGSFGRSFNAALEQR
jgi:RNA polymerase I-specific transcription initiation factor RRN3